jgi:hypothetical protein
MKLLLPTDSAIKLLLPTDSPTDQLFNWLATTRGPARVLFFPVYGAWMLGCIGWALTVHPVRSWQRLNGYRRARRLI